MDFLKKSFLALVFFLFVLSRPLLAAVPTLPFDELSEREMQVLIMITSGQDVSEVAAQLFLSSKTVNTYRYRIFEKLGVDNDVELTHLAMRYHLIDAP